MPLAEALATTIEYGEPPEDLQVVWKHLPQEWVDEALSATGTATLRRRRLPMEQVVWLVLGIALFRGRSITETVDKLDLALPSSNGRGVVGGAIPPARRRLGDEPMEWLFSRSAQEWASKSADSHRWRGLRVFGIDGTSLRVADSQVNREHFGSPASHRGESGYPQIRLAALMVLRSHLFSAVRCGPYEGSSEMQLAKELRGEIPNDSLTIVDRNYINAPFLLPLTTEGSNRHWLTRAKKNTRMRTISSFGPGDELVEMKVSNQARKDHPEFPKTWQARAIHYQRKGYRPQRLLTSLLDPEEFPEDEIVALYHERWEIELAYDEIKTEELLQEASLRSKSPKMVRQEMWGVFIAFNLVRLEMQAIAEEAGVAPVRISFVTALRMIRDEWLWSAITGSPGAIPKKLRQMRENLKRFILPPRRSERSYPRAVRIKISNYKRKRPTTTGEMPK